MTVAGLIKEAGGRRAVASALEVNMRTVSRWIARNSVPRAAFIALEAMRSERELQRKAKDDDNLGKSIRSEMDKMPG